MDLIITIFLLVQATPMEQRIKQMANSRELKANLRRDDNALELAALYVRALYLWGGQ